MFAILLDRYCSIQIVFVCYFDSIDLNLKYKSNFKNCVDLQTSFKQFIKHITN